MATGAVIGLNFNQNPTAILSDSESNRIMAPIAIAIGLDSNRNPATAIGSDFDRNLTIVIGLNFDCTPIRLLPNRGASGRAASGHNFGRNPIGRR